MATFAALTSAMPLTAKLLAKPPNRMPSFLPEARLSFRRLCLLPQGFGKQNPLSRDDGIGALLPNRYSRCGWLGSAAPAWQEGRHELSLYP